MKEAIIIFTRVPIAGETKTRMMPHLTAKECANLHVCFLKDIAAECKKTGKDIYVFYTPEKKANILVSVFGVQVQYRSQYGQNLGERMKNAFQAVFQEGYGVCVLIGSDVPEVREKNLNQAFSVLDFKDVVFGPAGDGGYYLLGMKQLHTTVFENQTYGHDSVLVNSVRALKAKNLTVGYSKVLQDMDTAEDLRNFLKRRRKRQDDLAYHTEKYLQSHRKISVIIPLYNEAKTIHSIQKQLELLKNKCEIIFVDGGSTDQTLQKIKRDFRIIHSQKGRANQMNEGAKASSGDVLLFLHCDSKLPQNSLGQIRHVMKSYRVGGFGVAFESKNFFMFTCRILSNFRMKFRNIIFGDQGIFVEREFFFELGMFPELPIMEDYQFSLNLKKRKEPIGMTRYRIYSSDRRYPKGTISKLKLMWKMYKLRKMYRNQVPIEKILDLYKDIR